MKKRKEPGVLSAAVLHINQISRREIVGDTFARLNATQTCP